jgi:hypothetical protein
MIGRTISHYHVVAELGAGGMGVVYRARDTLLERFVALKLLPADAVVDEGRQRRFLQEARAASALKPSQHRHDLRRDPRRRDPRDRDGTDRRDEPAAAALVGPIASAPGAPGTFASRPCRARQTRRDNRASD